MTKRILTALVLLTGLFGAGGAVWAGDFDKGWKAWESEDYATALKEWRPLAEQGNADAQDWLGHMYRYGQGVTEDKAEAAKWIRKSAEQGYAEGQLSLGRLYAEGEGVTKDHAEAVKWYRKAAERGDALAQVRLGGLYEDGDESVLQDLVAAHMWFNIAVANGTPMHFARDRVERKLSPSEVVEAEKRAKRCMESKYKDCEAEPKSWWQKLLD